MEIRKIRPADAEKFVEFYEKLVKESDYLMFTPKETAEKAKQEQKYIEDYDDYKQVFSISIALQFLRKFSIFSGNCKQDMV